MYYEQKKTQNYPAILSCHIFTRQAEPDLPKHYL